MIDGGTIFRSALDEPTPPEPPESEREDDGHHHHHLPPLILYRNGGVETNGIEATLLVGWFHVASFVAICVVIWHAWQWVRLVSLGANFHAGLVGGAVTAGLVLYVVIGAGIAIYQPSRLRRTTPVALLVAGAVLLGWAIDRWWMP